MEKIKVYSLEGEVVGEIELPEIFMEEFRPDLIKRAVISSQTARYSHGEQILGQETNNCKSFGSGRGAAMVPRVKGSRHPAG